MLMPGHCSVGIVGSSTGYNRLWYSENAYNVFPYKLNDLFLFDGCEGFDLYLLIEVVGGNE